MKKKSTNIAKILKDCPRGTELYSPLCGKCYFDRINMGTHKSEKYIDTPTISQVLKWLREEKKIFITVLFITDCSNDADNDICEVWHFWSFSVINLNDGSTLYDDFERIDCIEYQSYEESALAGIEYVLDNLI